MDFQEFLVNLIYNLLRIVVHDHKESFWKAECKEKEEYFFIGFEEDDEHKFIVGFPKEKFNIADFDCKYNLEYNYEASIDDPEVLLKLIDGK